MTVHPLPTTRYARNELKLAKFPEVVLHETGMEFTKPISAERWRELGRHLAFFDKASAFIVGDWAVYGEQHLGDHYADEIAEESGYDTNSVRVCQWVAEHIPPESRRPDLSWSHHRAVASLEPAAQQRFLTEAASEGLTTRELYERSHPPKTPLEAPPSPQQAAEAVSDALRPVLGMFVEPEHIEDLLGRVMKVLRSQGVLV